jgi:hypothetical protein
MAAPDTGSITPTAPNSGRPLSAAYQSPAIRDNTGRFIDPFRDRHLNDKVGQQSDWLE